MTDSISAQRRHPDHSDAEVRDFPVLDDAALIRLRTLTRLGLGEKSSIYARVKAGTFPPGVRVGGARRWTVGAIRRHLESLGVIPAAETRATEAPKSAIPTELEA